MEKHYPFLLLLFLIALPQGGHAQQPEQFSLRDFQLRGPVRTCVVKASYGEERFEFDREGRLLKSLTQYNEEDYDITYYRFRDGILYERRDEAYRGGTFDPQISIAHFYERDSADGKMLTETILSYDRAIREQVDFTYTPDGTLSRIVHATPQGVDDTRVETETLKGETTTSYFLSDQLQRSVRKSEVRKGGQTYQVVLTKEYAGGAPQKAVEEIRNTDGRLVKETTFGYDPQKESFFAEEVRELEYDAQGLLSQERITNPTGDREPVVRQFVYQMDGKTPPNWVRQVTTPENSYVVRSLVYYEPESPKVAADSLRN